MESIIEPAALPPWRLGRVVISATAILIVGLGCLAYIAISIYQGHVAENAFLVQQVAATTVERNAERDRADNAEAAELELTRQLRDVRSQLDLTSSGLEVATARIASLQSELE